MKKFLTFVIIVVVLLSVFAFGRFAYKWISEFNEQNQAELIDLDIPYIKSTVHFYPNIIDSSNYDVPSYMHSIVDYKKINDVYISTYFLMPVSRQDLEESTISRRDIHTKIYLYLDVFDNEHNILKKYTLNEFDNVILSLKNGNWFSAVGHGGIDSFFREFDLFYSFANLTNTFDVLNVIYDDIDEYYNTLESDLFITVKQVLCKIGLSFQIFHAFMQGVKL